jgi:hypothetical protein
MSVDQPTIRIAYTEKQMVAMQHPYSRLRPIEEGDSCCNCGLDCDDAGFVIGNVTAHRVNGHPLCARLKCQDAQLDEFAGRRSGCRCKRSQG